MRPASDKIIATEELAFCKWSSRGAGPLQMIIQRDWALANDHPEGATSCESSSRVARLLQMIICHPRHPSQLCQDPHSISQTFLGQFVHVFNFLASQITNVGKPFLFDQTLLIVVLLQVEYREFRREYTGITTRQKKWWLYLLLSIHQWLFFYFDYLVTFCQLSHIAISALNTDWRPGQTTCLRFVYFETPPHY